MDWRISLVKEFAPILIAFILGVIVAWQGCGSEPQTITIEKPIPTIEYVDRWKVDTVRFVRKQLVTRYDTVYSEKVVTRLDTLLLIDTLKIVETWLSEVANYDTTVNDVHLKWSNYQNRTENLTVQYKRKEQKFSFGIHGLVGLQTDFIENHKPMFGVGLHGSIKKTYISAQYGYNGQHYVGVGIGRNLISR